MNKVTRIAVTVSSSACLVFGAASVAGASMIVDTNSHAILINSVSQTAVSGPATSVNDQNNNVGTMVQSGNANNITRTASAIIVDASTPADADSDVLEILDHPVTTTTLNNLVILNTMSQTAVTGDVSIRNSAHAGSVASGSARNDSLTSSSVINTQ